MWVFVVTFWAYQVFSSQLSRPGQLCTQVGTDAKSLRHFVENDMHHLPIHSTLKANVRCFYVCKSQKMFSLLLNLRIKKNQTIFFLFLLWPVVHMKEGDMQDESDATKCIGCILIACFQLPSPVCVLCKSGSSLEQLSNQEPDTTVSQPAINRSWATTKAL